MNSSDVNLTSPDSAPLTMSLLTPLSINVLPAANIPRATGPTVDGKAFQFDSGYTVDRASKPDDRWNLSFSISDGTNTIFFDLTVPLRSGRIMLIFPTRPASRVIKLLKDIVTAINNAGLSGVTATWLGSLGGQYQGQVNIGGVPASTVPVGGGDAGQHRRQLHEQHDSHDRPGLPPVPSPETC